MLNVGNILSNSEVFVRYFFILITQLNGDLSTTKNNLTSINNSLSGNISSINNSISAINGSIFNINNDFVSANWIPSNGYNPLSSNNFLQVYSVNANLKISQGVPSGLSEYATCICFGKCEYKILMYIDVFGAMAIWSTNENRWAIPNSRSGYYKNISFTSWPDTGRTITANISDYSEFKNISQSNIVVGIQHCDGHGTDDFGGDDIGISAYCTEYDARNGNVSILLTGNIRGGELLLCII